MSLADASAPEDSDPPLFPRGMLLLPWLVWCLVLPIAAGFGGPIYAKQIKREDRQTLRILKRSRAEQLEKRNAAKSRERESLNLGRRAYDSGDFRGADREFSKYLETHPRNLDASWLRGLARFELMDLENAQEDFSAVIRLNPNHAYAHRSRGQIRALLGDTQGGVEDMIRSSELEPGSAYPPIWIAGLGGGDVRLRPFASSTDWISEVARFYVGRITEQELIDRANAAPTFKTKTDQLCEAYGYIGLLAERDGNLAKALRNYELCVGTGVRNFIEYRWAQIRLTQESQKAAPEGN
jgi:lipoprotein NlpI